MAGRQNSASLVTAKAKNDHLMYSRPSADSTIANHTKFEDKQIGNTESFATVCCILLVITEVYEHSHFGFESTRQEKESCL